MLKILKKVNDELSVLDELTGGSWVCAIDPSAAEIARLQEMGVPQSFITSSLDSDERARTDRENSATLIILRVPYDCGKGAEVRYRTVPLGIILVGEYLVTICKSPIAVLDTLLESRAHVISTTKRNRLILHLLLATAQSYLRYLKGIDSEVEELERRLLRSLRNEEVLELLAYQKSLVYFTTGLKSNELMMKRLERSQIFETYSEDHDLLDDVLTEITQAAEMTQISSNILNQMMDAYASIISNNLNVVMKFLASATIILSFPTMVASIYGMNVPLPFQEEGRAFALIMLAALSVSIFVAIVFRKKNWM